MAQSKFEYVSLGNWLFLTFLRIWARLTAAVVLRRYVVTGRENIPKNGPVIFAVNHQSAFLDPVLIGISCGRKPWYLTRAGVFVNPVVRYILRAIHMLPVYRNRDQVNVRTANHSTFERSSEILCGGGSLLIFPEGNHGMMKMLRTPLRKGLARIALGTLTAPNSPSDILIVPVGINYEHPTRIRTDVLIRYGQPVSVASYRDVYENNQAEGLKILTRELEVAMEAEMINISPQEAYDQLEENWLEARKPCSDLQKRFNEDRKMLQSGNFEGSSEKSGNVTRWVMRVLLFPVFLLGLVLNLPLLLLGKLILFIIVRDPHFLQSFKFVLAMVCAPLYALGVGWIGAVIFGYPFWLGTVLSPLAGILAYDYFDLLIRSRVRQKSSVLMGDYQPSH